VSQSFFLINFQSKTRVLQGRAAPSARLVRTNLEKQGLIDYGAVPDLVKPGFEIIVVTFGKRKYQKYPKINLQKAKDFAERQPSIIFGAAGRGLGYDRIAVSIHRDYSDYSKFSQELRKEWVDMMDIRESFMVSLTSKEVIQSLSLKHLVDHLKNEKES
jgi:hypothetical protein